MPETKATETTAPPDGMEAIRAVARMGETLLSLLALNRQMQAKIDALRAENALLRDNKPALAATIDALRVQNDALRAENDARCTRAVVLRTERDALRFENASRQGLVDALRTEIVLLRAENDAFQEQKAGPTK